jgi:hypothetical protein
VIIYESQFALNGTFAMCKWARYVVNAVLIVMKRVPQGTWGLLELTDLLKVGTGCERAWKVLDGRKGAGSHCTLRESRSNLFSSGRQFS